MDPYLQRQVTRPGQHGAVNLSLGHFPVEEPGLSQLVAVLVAVLKKIYTALPPPEHSGRHHDDVG